MNAAPSPTAAQEINRLHAEVIQLTEESKTGLHAALAAAWRVGQLLIAERQRVRRTMGGGAWQLWLKQNFRGSLRTAQNYVRLAESVTDVSVLHGMSLRQAYLHLGIATEPKSRAASPHVEALPPHVRLAHRLLVALKPCADPCRVSPEQSAAYRRELPRYLSGLFRLPVFHSSSFRLLGMPWIVGLPARVGRTSSTIVPKKIRASIDGLPGYKMANHGGWSRRHEPAKFALQQMAEDRKPW